MHNDPESVLRRLIEEGFNQGRLEIADELTHPESVEHQAMAPGIPTTPGPEGVRRVISSLRRAFPDFHLEIEDTAVDGDKVWVRMTGTGTNDGPFMGHEPTGRAMRTEVFDVLRVVDGQIVEHWGVPDRLGAWFQLGFAEPPVPVGAATSAAG